MHLQPRYMHVLLTFMHLWAMLSNNMTQLPSPVSPTSGPGPQLLPCHGRTPGAGWVVEGEGEGEHKGEEGERGVWGTGRAGLWRRDDCGEAGGLLGRGRGTMH